jgi:tRNA 2-thiouridine synthesizing protein A
MTMTQLDLTGLKCPLPALKTRKALKGIGPGDRLEATERDGNHIVFVIEKAMGPAA